MIVTKLNPESILILIIILGILPGLGGRRKKARNMRGRKGVEEGKYLTNLQLFCVEGGSEFTDLVHESSLQLILVNLRPK